MIEVCNKIIRVVSITTFISCHVIYRSTSFQFDDSLKCDGEINYPWISPNDEANCSSQCPSSGWSPPLNTPCDCNKPGNMKCEGSGWICYYHYGKILVYIFKSFNNLLF